MPSPPRARLVARTFRSFADFDECTRDGGIDLSRTGARLTPRVVVADELGDTNPRATEPFGGRILVRKHLVIADPRVRAATLAPYLFCKQPGATLTVRVNGHPLTLRWPEQREYWRDSWTPIPIPVRLLKKGLNEFAFSGDEGAGWALVIEHARWPRRSAKSVDGGRTWSFSGLGGTGAFLHGEYLVRLELARHEPEGAITSPPIDLARLAGGVIAPMARIHEVTLTPTARTPAGTSVTLSARFGPSPSYDPATWSAWRPASRPIRSLPPETRFVQWQAVLRTKRALATPLLRAVKVAAKLAVQPPAVSAAIAKADNPPIVRSSYPFAHQRFEERRLALFRKKWALDAVVRPDRTDFENLVALRDWTRHQWEDGWNSGPTDFIPPWDGFVILELASRQLSLGMCTHYAAAFVHTCVALGFNVRIQIMRSHCIAEVWSNHLRKWVAFDVGGDTSDARKLTFHFERAGVPLSALEIHRALLAGQLDELRFSPPEAAEAFKLEDRVKLFERFCIHNRNDEMSSLEPGEPEHGAKSYHYDEYLWWADPKTRPFPWFSRCSTREGDFHWTLNHAEIHLQHTAEPGRLRVLLDTETPNLDTLFCRIDGSEWQPCEASFLWPLHPGANVLEVRPRTKFGHEGIISRVEVERRG